ncbi:MAG: hypothetical protein AVDCRST_MAG20-1407 [uncultured Acidimicrobiales bacterium]|uniref:Uncharacterized protein n=1 Tax=uncultured Acidimicrobiales bacterium TaxID=310071 RepID=A0A6J4HZ72_9ACTN|nr:MAG: hypothetical protein AVDCRST_MAG20-1407 [uncultured Acidimicrobiales bacterium]
MDGHHVGGVATAALAPLRRRSHAATVVAGPRRAGRGDPAGGYARGAAGSLPGAGR